jgi:DNA-binding response OmpR family regulator
MMNATNARIDDTSARSHLSGAQAEFVADLGKVCGEIANALRQAAAAVAADAAGDALEKAIAGLRRQAQRAQGFRLHGLAEELKILAERVQADDADLPALAKAAEDAPRLGWHAPDDHGLHAVDRPLTPVPNSGLRDRSTPVAVPARGDFRVRIVGGAEVNGWAEARTDVALVESSSGRGDLLVIDAREGQTDAVRDALRGALEPLVVVLGDRALAQAHGAIAVDQVAELGGIVELAKSRREVALATTTASSPARSARDLGLDLVDELHRALVDNIDPASAPVAVPLGRDPMITAALWSAIARIRELVSRRTEGRVRFADPGPEGVHALAAEISEEIRTPERRRTEGRASDVALTGLRALVVDDDEVVTWFIGEQLRAAGMMVTEVYDGETARGVAERERPDIVVSDVIMPGMDGLTLGRALRRDVTLGDVPVVLLSWKEDLLRRVRELGTEADGYVRKESDGEHLLAAVREALRPRLRLAARLGKEDVILGRLDGMTSFTLARLVAEKRQTARLVVRDGRHVFELEFAGGLMASCTRSGADGSLLRGRRALASYLGVRSARFEIAPIGRMPNAETAKPLGAAVEPLVERARASVELVVERWLSLASVEVDLDLVDSGAPALPSSLKRGLDGLRDGMAPHRLVASGAVDADGLLALLLDLARRGAIVSARDTLGTDRLQEALERVRVRSLVEAPRARFSRPIAVPVPTDSLEALPHEAPRAQLDILAEEDVEPALERSTLDAIADDAALLAIATPVPVDAAPGSADIGAVVLALGGVVSTGAAALPSDAEQDLIATAREANGEAPCVALSEETAEPCVESAIPTARESGLTPVAASPAEPPVAALVPTPAPPTMEVASGELAVAPASAVPVEGALAEPVAANEAVAPPSAAASVRAASPIVVKPRTISWIGFLLALGLVAVGGTVASWVAVRNLSPGRVPSVFR